MGSTTLQHPQFSGAESDECFYIDNIKSIQCKKRLDLTTDPNLLILAMAEFLQQVGTIDYLALVKAFRSWMKNQLVG